MTNSSETASWFNRTFPDYANVPIESTLNDEDFWYLLARKLNQSPLAGIALLDGLTYSEAIEFMRAGSVLDCPAGGRIMKKGQIGREMYVILSGAVKVLAGADDAVVARLEKGELFGELAYLSESPRTADIIADEDVELLVLTQKMMEKALAEMPAIAARILFNLSLILCGRLKNSTAVLVSAAQGQKSDASTGEEMPESPEIAEAG
jgi:CRP-like cAMP-binding protein